MLKRIINLGAVYYAAISAVLLVFAWMFGDAHSVIEPSKFLFLLLFSFVASTGTAIKESDLMGKTAGSICHAVCYIGGFFFCVILPYDKGFTFAVIMLALFSVGYAVACILKSVTCKHTKKSKNSQKNSNTQKSMEPKKKTSKKAQDTEYKSLFSDNSK